METSLQQREHPCTWARSLARSGAPSEECDAPLPYPDPSPGRWHPYLQTLGPPKCHPLHVGQQALMNKRPIRRRGAADEWIFRFQAWHRLGFPGVQGRAGRSRLPEWGHAWGQRVLKTPTSPLATGLVGEVHRRPSCGNGSGAAEEASLRPRNSAPGPGRPSAGGSFPLPPRPRQL